MCDDDKNIEDHQMYPTMPLTENEIENQLLSDKADIAFIEKSRNDKNFSSGLEYHLIGVEAPIFITSKHNPVSSLSQDAILEIFTTESSLNWSQYGGNNGEIHILGDLGYLDGLGMKLLQKTVLDGYNVKTNRFTKEQYDDLFAGYGDMKPLGASYSQTPDYVLDCAPFYCLTLGFPIDAGEVERIKPILLNNVMPTNENILNGGYPSLQSYVVIKKSLHDDDNIIKLVDWLCNSDESTSVKAYSGIGMINGIDEDWLKIWEIWDEPGTYYD